MSRGLMSPSGRHRGQAGRQRTSVLSDADFRGAMILRAAVALLALAWCAAAAADQQKLLPLIMADGDEFGCTVSVSGNTAIVGAPLDDDKGEEAIRLLRRERRGKAGPYAVESMMARCYLRLRWQAEHRVQVERLRELAPGRTAPLLAAAARLIARRMFA